VAWLTEMTFASFSTVGVGAAVAFALLRWVLRYPRHIQAEQGKVQQLTTRMDDLDRRLSSIHDAVRSLGDRVKPSGRPARLTGDSARW